MMTAIQPILRQLAILALLVVGISGTQAQEPLRYPLGIRGNFSPQGMQIQSVTPASEAERVGLRQGDVITKIDGQLITNQGDLVRILNSSGGEVVLLVRKGGKGGEQRVAMDLTGGVKRGGIAAPYSVGIGGVYKPEGMLVQIVLPHSPAAAAGIQKGDLIVRLNNVPIRNQADLFQLVSRSGGTLVIEYLQGASGQPRRVNAELRVAHFGALGVFSKEGMQLRVITPTSAADRAGLQVGDVIFQIDQKPIHSQSDFDNAIRSSSGTVAVAVRRAGMGAALVRVDLMNNPLGAWCEPGTDGLRVTTVGTGTAADALGLQRGDVILKIDNVRVHSNKEMTDALNQSGGVATILVRKGDSGQIVRLDAFLTR